MNDKIFFIIYPSGDRTKISISYLTTYNYHEKSDYAVASRKDFYYEDEAITYAKKLASDNNLLYVYEEGFLD